MKNTRGVQQEEVWVAADALLAVGQRPTIERVRLHLGRGSPNTVAPMLETWFAGLGKRLGMAGDGTEKGKMPVAVIQAMAKMWDAALLAAHKEAEAALALEIQAIATGHALLSDRESKLLQQEQALVQRQEMMEQLLQAEREKTATAEGSLVAIKSQLLQRDNAISELRATLTNTQDQLQTVRTQNDNLVRSHAEERNKWEKRTTGNERRLLSELDRERLATKEATVATDAANALAQTTRSDFEARMAPLAQKQRNNEIDLEIARNALENSERRITELTAQQNEQRSTNAALHEQLNQALSAISRTSAPSKRKSTSNRTAPKEGS